MHLDTVAHTPKLYSRALSEPIAPSQSMGLAEPTGSMLSAPERWIWKEANP